MLGVIAVPLLTESDGQATRQSHAQASPGIWVVRARERPRHPAAYGLALAWADVLIAARAAEGKLPELC